MVSDSKWMQRALEHGRRGLGRTSPHPVVGACVITRDGVAVGDGAHERAGDPHAEVLALEEAGPRARGATLYCTLEPCVHEGRTGSCINRIASAGIARVVAAIEDPNPLVQGRGFAALRGMGVEVVVGVEAAAAERLNQPFLTAWRQGRPFTILKAATSLEGYLGVFGKRTPLTGREAQRHVHSMRAQVDALVVGSGTVLIDDPALTVREVYRERPLTRVVLDRRLRTPVGARVLQTLAAGPVIIVTVASDDHEHGVRRRQLEDAGATLLTAEADGVAAVLRQLARRGIQSVVLEGGGLVHAASWNEGVVDYVQVYVSSVSLEAGGPRIPDGSFSTASLDEKRVVPLGADVLIEGYVHRSG